MPDTGGANVPALNDLLSSWGIALSDRVFEGDFTLGEHSGYFASGTSIIQFPPSGLLVSLPLKDQGKSQETNHVLILKAFISISDALMFEN